MREPWQPQCPATTSGHQCEKEEGHEGSHAHETDASIVWGSFYARPGEPFRRIDQEGYDG